MCRRMRQTMGVRVCTSVRVSDSMCVCVNVTGDKCVCKSAREREGVHVTEYECASVHMWGGGRACRGGLDPQPHSRGGLAALLRDTGSGPSVAWDSAPSLPSLSSARALKKWLWLKIGTFSQLPLLPSILNSLLPIQVSTVYPLIAGSHCASHCSSPSLCFFIFKMG